MVHRKAVPDGLGRVVLADGELAAAVVADTLGLRGGGDDVVSGAAVQAGAPAGHALHDGLVVHIDGEGAVDLYASLLERFGLGDGAGHAVEDVAVGAVALGEPFLDDADDDIVGDQRAGFDVLLGLQPHGRAVFHGRAQDVAC